MFLWSVPIRLCVKAAPLSLFLQTLRSVLTHRGTALSANKQADRLTLRPQPLLCTEALSLLLCWASLSRNTTLLSQIHALSEKHKVKELLGECPRVFLGWLFTKGVSDYCCSSGSRWLEILQWAFWYASSIISRRQRSQKLCLHMLPGTYPGWAHHVNANQIQSIGQTLPCSQTLLPLTFIVQVVCNIQLSQCCLLLHMAHEAAGGHVGEGVRATSYSFCLPVGCIPFSLWYFK